MNGAVMNAAPAAAEARHFSFAYAGREAPTLRDVNLRLEPGTWTLLAGASGSGKSTLLRALAGITAHHSRGIIEGSIEVAGDDVAGLSPVELASRVGLLLQSPDDQICSTTVGSEVAFGLENLRVPPREIDRRVAEALAKFGLAGRQEQTCATLSGGQKQRLLLAAIMAMSPGVLLLDEPLSQLDGRGTAELLATLESLRRDGMTIVMAEHRLDDIVARVDRVLLLQGGCIVYDAPAAQIGELVAHLPKVGLEPPEVAVLARVAGVAPTAKPAELVAELRARQKILRSPKVPLPTLQPSNVADTIVKLRGVSFTYRSAKQPALDLALLDIERFERIALVGGNGSGKSTLLGVLAGLLEPKHGTRMVMAAGRPAIGLVPQNPDVMLFCGTVREELEFGPRQQGLAVGSPGSRTGVAQRQEAKLARLKPPLSFLRQGVRSNDTDLSPEDATDWAERVARQLGLDFMLSEAPLALSQGERLRVAVAATLCMRPALMALDEPTTGQDQPSVARVMRGLVESVRAQEIGALVFSTHDLRSVVTYANRVLVLCGGRIVADCTPMDLVESDQMLETAQLTRTPLLDVRHELGLRGLTLPELCAEVHA